MVNRAPLLSVALAAGASLAAALAAGCSTGFDDPTIVRDLRVLGISVEASEIVVDAPIDDPVALAAFFADSGIVFEPPLVADPGAERDLRYDWTFCPPTESMRCDDPEAPSALVGGDSIADPERDPGGVMTSSGYRVPLEIVRAALESTSIALFGVPIQVQLRVWPEGEAPGGPDTIYASKRVVFVPKIPDSRTDNRNPRVAELRFDKQPGDLVRESRCADPDEAFHTIARGQKVALLPVPTDGSRETYMVPTFDGDIRTITENLRVSWFATAGSFSAGQSGGPTDAFGNVPDLDTNYTAPDEVGTVQLWVVTRDERGGASWNLYCLQVL